MALFVQSLGKVHAVIDAAKIHIIASKPLILTNTYIHKQQEHMDHSFLVLASFWPAALLRCRLRCGFLLGRSRLARAQVWVQIVQVCHVSLLQ